ncbi:exonuclease domain-containing protein [Gluconobacter cerevisiae]|uniref:exonuclease domain-containing protein n=1 Tax=Gluconobacter cerevisiae TaxID=1379734 RepID=UPI001884D8AD
MSEAAPNLADLADILSASNDYRVQRRLKSRSNITQPDGTPTKTAILVDVETTGLDLQNDEIIELAMISFTYSLDGRIFEIGQTFQHFQEPSRPISAEITRITNAMVADHKIDIAEVATFVSSAALVIAHNAGFDRRFA